MAPQIRFIGCTSVAPLATTSVAPLATTSVAPLRTMLSPRNYSQLSEEERRERFTVCCNARRAIVEGYGGLLIVQSNDSLTARH